MNWLLYAGGSLILVGAVFGLLAAVGLLRFPDVYSRLHATSLAGLLGVGTVLLGLFVSAPDGAGLFRTLAALLFLALATPVAGHLLARAAFVRSYPPAKATAIDREGIDLRDAERPETE